MYCEWIQRTPEQLIKEYESARKKLNTLQSWKRDTKNSIVEFYNYLKSTKHYKINTARSTPLGILRFYHSHCEQLEEVTKEFDSIQLPENEFVFTQETLRKMHYYADTNEKALLSSAVSLGYSSIDFLELETEKIRNLVNQAKSEHLDIIGFIGKTREKTSIQPRSYLTPEAIESINEYLTLRDKDGKVHKYLWSNDYADTPITNQSLNARLKKMVSKANIDTYNKEVKFHAIRKFLYSNLQRLNRDIAKVITAKKVDTSIITYITDLDKECERVFREAYKGIALNGDVSGKHHKEQSQKVDDLTNALSQLENENKALRTRIEMLQKNQNVIAEVSTELMKEKMNIKKIHGVDTMPVAETKWSKLLSKLQKIKEDESKPTET